MLSFWERKKKNTKTMMDGLFLGEDSGMTGESGWTLGACHPVMSSPFFLRTFQDGPTDSVSRPQSEEALECHILLKGYWSSI